MKCYTVKHWGAVAYPLIEKEGVRWFGHPHVMHPTLEDAQAYKDKIMACDDDPIDDKELIIVEMMEE